MCKRDEKPRLSVFCFHGTLSFLPPVGWEIIVGDLLWLLGKPCLAVFVVVCLLLHHMFIIVPSTWTVVVRMGCSTYSSCHHYHPRHRLTRSQSVCLVIHSTLFR